MTATIIEFPRRGVHNCPHCDLGVLTVPLLDQHLRYDCPALRSRQQHPSNYRPGA